MDHVDWLVCAEEGELTLEVEVVEAQASVLWTLPPSDRLAPLKDIVEVSTLLGELWEEA